MFLPIQQHFMFLNENCNLKCTLYPGKNQPKNTFLELHSLSRKVGINKDFFAFRQMD
jgi:hypothetical protein